MRKEAATNTLYFHSTIFLGGFAGAVVLSLLIHLLVWIAAPQALGDGQYGMIFMATFPIGWIVGASWGTTIACHASVLPHYYKLFAAMWILGGFLVGPWLGLRGILLVVTLLSRFSPSDKT